MITATVVVAVPVVLWALVTVVRSYVTPARVPIHRPAALAAADGPKAAERAPAAPANQQQTAPTPQDSLPRVAVTDAQTAAAVAALAAGLPKTDRVAARAVQPAPSSAAAAAVPDTRDEPPSSPPMSIAPAAIAVPPPAARAPTVPAAPRNAFEAAPPAWQESLARAPSGPVPMPPSPPAQARQQQAAAPSASAPPAEAPPDRREQPALASAVDPATGSIPVPTARPRTSAAPAAVAGIGIPVPRPRPAGAPVESEPSFVPPPPGKDHNQF